MSGRTQRERQLLNTAPSDTEVQKRAAEGWRMVAVEWEREVEPMHGTAPEQAPFGLRLSPQTATLELEPEEWHALILMMEMTVQEGPYWTIAEELNRRGYRTRNGERWTPISVFQMLPRLIEVGPKIFETDEWRKRRRMQPAGD
ncbi:MAG TPA: recombinase family protein [Candidatus Koribacter sp.]|jgi:hypothetical protein